MDSNALPSELLAHQRFINCLKGIPHIDPKVLKTKTQDQILMSLWLKIWYSWLLRYIDYLQLLEMGYLPQNPLELVDSALFGELLRVSGDLDYARLKLIIHGFHFIADAASKNGRNFIFEDPRQLFAQILIDEANEQLTQVYSPELNQGLTITEFRDGLVEEAHFFRDKPEVDKQNMLRKFRNGGWDKFWLYGVWWNRDQELRPQWKTFLKCHKAYLRFFNKNRGNRSKTDSDRDRLMLVKWNNGKAVISESQKPPEWHLNDNAKILKAIPHSEDHAILLKILLNRT